MSLSTEEVNKIAWLGRIAIDDDKIEAYAHDLSGILDFVEQMGVLDTSSVCAHGPSYGPNPAPPSSNGSTGPTRLCWASLTQMNLPWVLPMKQAITAR